MASIIKTSINLSNIDKSKVIDGKKGKYLPITITLNDEVDQFGNQGPVVIAQTKDLFFIIFLSFANKAYETKPCQKIILQD